MPGLPFPRIFPLRAVRRLEVLARRSSVPSGTNSELNAQLGDDRTRSVSHAAAGKADQEEDGMEGDAFGSGNARSLQTQAPAWSNTNNRRAGYAHVTARNTAACPPELNPHRKSNTRSETPPELSAWQPPWPESVSPLETNVEFPRLPVKSSSSQRDSQRKPISTLRRREEEDYEHAVRMETKRLLEAVGRRSGARTAQAAERAGEGYVLEVGEIFGVGENHIQDLGEELRTFAVAGQAGDPLHPSDLDDLSSPPSFDNLDFYRHWQANRVEDEVMGSIRRGERIGQRVVLPSLLDKASKVRLAQLQVAQEQRNGAAEDPSPAPPNNPPVRSPSTFPSRLLPDYQAALASDPATQATHLSGRSPDGLLKLNPKGDKKVRAWVRGEIEEKMADWDRIAEDLAKLSFEEEHRHRPRPGQAPPSPPAKSRATKKLKVQSAPSSDQAAIATAEPASETDDKGIRRNQVGIQLLSPALHPQLFPGQPLPKPPRQIVDISLAHLADNGLSPSGTSTAPDISFDMPPLLGGNIREHFDNIGRGSAEPYLSASHEFANTVLPPKPRKWSADGPGWRKYLADGIVENVEDLGGETMICFDVETMYLKSPYAVMATAVTPNAWYSWTSPALFAQPGEIGVNGKRLDHASSLIPLTRSDHTTPAIVIGHNVGYDRARVLDEYQMGLSNNRWLDTLSFHVATKGITSVQRPAWQKRSKEKSVNLENLAESQSILRDIEGVDATGFDDVDMSTDSKETRWEDVSGPNSLATVADLHCGIKLSKDVRNRFGDPNMDSATEFMPDIQLLLDYCASDVATTHAVFCKVLPLFLESCPHPASFAGAVGMGNPFLPIDDAWAKYLQQAEAKYQENLGGVQAILAELAYKLKKRGRVKGDLWTEQLDWKEKTPRWTDEEVEGPSAAEVNLQQEAEGEGLLSAIQEAEGKGILSAHQESLAKPRIMYQQPILQQEERRSLSALGEAWESVPSDWQDKLAKWTDTKPHPNTLGDVLPYILRVTYRGRFPLIEHPEHRWIVQVPASSATDQGAFGLEKLDVGSGQYVYFKPPSAVRPEGLPGASPSSEPLTTGGRILSPLVKARRKDWQRDVYQSPYRDLVEKLIKGAARESLNEEIDKAAKDFADPSKRIVQVASAALVRPPSLKVPTKPSRSLGAHGRLESWPKWFWDLTLPRSRAAAGELDLTVRKRIAPLLLRMAWKGHPLAYSRQYGWTYRVDARDPGASSYTALEFTSPVDVCLAADKDAIYCKVPHVSGEDANVGNPLSKAFLQYIVNGTLASAEGAAGDDDGDIASAASHAMQMNAQCSYWTSSRERISGQMAVYAKDVGGIGLPSTVPERDYGMILPQVITMGTVTRRAVESTWLTASNAKKNRVGSELKAMIRAPPGYAIVGADVDSEELWIASVMGDAQFGVHGASAIGWMTLEGTKSAGTDVHSKTAKILGTSRDYAKVFNYSRIYGAGTKHAMQLLIQNNAELPTKEAKQLADDLYKATKGTKTFRPKARAGETQPATTGSGHMWHGGSESYLFNTLESVAYSGNPMTPGLGAGVTLALRQKFLPKDGVFGSDYLPSRINWVVQSSGVDYLHLLIVSMDYLIKRHGIQARYMISVHDEVRYLVQEQDKYRAALALQISNAWTRTLLSYNLGLGDLPQGVAFFSAVDIDHVFRKEVDMDCVTPSNPVPIPKGESLDIGQLLEITKGDLGLVAEASSATRSTSVSPPTPFRPPDLHSRKHALMLEAQACKDPSLVRAVLRTSE